MTAPDDGNYKVSSFSLNVTCLRCGVHIGNRVIHDRWHASTGDAPPAVWPAGRRGDEEFPEGHRVCI